MQLVQMSIERRDQALALLAMGGAPEGRDTSSQFITGFVPLKNVDGIVEYS